MDLRQLKQFVVLAEERSFRAASERLFMAQPPLSVAIRKLEEEIGTPLFVRSSRGVRLTPAGLGALESARRCLDAAADVATNARSAVAGEVGTLHIGFSGSVTLRLLPRLVRAVSQRYPNVRLELREGTNQELLALVEARTLDLGFVRVPTSRPPDVLFHPIEQDAFCVALPPGHPLAAQEMLSLHDLGGQPFIGYAPSPVGGLHAAASLLLQRAGVAPHITQEAVQVQTVLGLVASGLGLALVPAANTPLQSSAGAVFRPLSDLPADASIGIALARHSRSENPAVQRFLQTIAAEEAGDTGDAAEAAP
ncbi:LysR family transcriptional regulator [Xylophilus sp. GW821-FHT01B05]